MPTCVRISPAIFWRAFFILLAGTVPLSAANTGASRPPELSQLGAPDQAEARGFLEDFRKSGIPGQYFLDFELQSLPRRGATTSFRGRLWGGRNAGGAINRVELTDAAGKVHRLLVQNGARPGVWRLNGNRAEQVSVAASFEPVLPDLELTAFDLQMPFLFWPDAKFEKLTRSFRGRPAHLFHFTAPADFAGQAAGVTGARAYLDTQYNALMQTELLGDTGVKKTMSLVDLKRVTDPVSKAEQWIPKSLEWRDETTRDKTRLVVTGVALDQQFAPTLFEPTGLTENIMPPTRILRVNP